MIQVTLDFETASGVDLKVVGADRYALDPTTEILSLTWRLNGGANHLYRPGGNNIDLTTFAADPATIFVAHNASFEQAIWREIMVTVFGFPPLPPERWHCTQASAAYRGLPLNLDRLARVHGLPVTKDLVGKKITMSFSRPDKKTGMLPERTVERMERVYAYNGIDVDLTAPIFDWLGPLPPDERAVWLLDQRINQRGVRLDLPFVRACSNVVEAASVPLVREFRDLCGLSPTQSQAFLKWCRDNGADLPNMRKETVARLLGETEDEDVGAPGGIGSSELDLLPGNVRRALAIRSTVGSSSIKKLPRMAASVCPDGRSRGLLQYHGAQPGRWSGRSFQPQNFPRYTIKHDIAEAVAAIMAEDLDAIRAKYGEPIDLVVSSLRHAIIASPGRLFGCGDFAGIEARLVLAVSGQHDKCALMASGADVYCDMAGTIFGRKITKADTDERQAGKATVLGAGYGMGWRTFKDRYCRDKPDEFAQASINAYRKEWAPAVPKLWRGLEDAALRAAYSKTNQPFEAYGIVFRKEEGFLSARLYDGKKLWYYNPQPCRRKMPWLDDAGEPVWRDAWTFQTQKLGQWTTVDAYGGLLTQNIVGEGLGRQLLVAAMFRLEKAGLPCVLTVHDEVLTEPVWSEDRADDLRKLVEEIMAEPPDWAKQIKLPIGVEGWAGRRYRK